MRPNQQRCKRTISPDKAGTDLHTGRVFHGNDAAHLAFTGERQTIEADFKLSRRLRCRGITRQHRRRQRDVASLVGEGDVEAFTILLCRAEGRGKRTVSANKAGAHRHARRVFHGDGTARLAFTRQGQTIDADDQVGWRHWCSGVPGNHWRGHRDVACLVRQGDVEGLAIFLRC